MFLKATNGTLIIAGDFVQDADHVSGEPEDTFFI